MIGRMLAHLRRSLAFGWPLAAAWGLCEAGYYWLAGRATVGGPRILPSGIVLYLLLGTVGAVVLGLVVALADRLRGGRLAPTAARYAALYAALAVVLPVGYFLNQRVLGGSLDVTSLAADAALFFLGVPLLARLFAAPAKAVAQGGAGPWRRLRAPFWVGIALALTLPLLGPDPTVGAAPPAASPREGAPNVLFVLIDTLRADHLSCYGYERETSPRLDQLAQEGVLFENCISQAPHTKPSTASILTSLYPPTHRVDHFTSSLAPEAVTLHEVFHDAGYRTALLSANSFLSPTYGFGSGVERFRGSIVNPVFQLKGSTVMHRLRRVFVQELRTWRAPWDFFRAIVNFPFPQSEYQHEMPAAAIEKEFLAWLDEIGEGPWLGYLQYMEPHAPYAPAPEHRLFDNPTDPEAGVWFPGSTQIMFLPFRTGEEVSAKERRDMVANYDACIHEVDAAIGRLLDELEARGELENTIVVVTSDHGEEFYDHGAWGHGQSLHRELVHVPLILRGPSVPAGERVNEQVRSVDIMPTLIALAGLPDPGSMDGEVLALRDAEARDAYSEVQWGGHSAQSLRRPDGTMILARFSGQEAALLFDPTADPDERTDLGPSSTARLSELKKELLARHEELSENALEARQAAIDEGAKAALEELGYVDNPEAEAPEE